MSGYVKQRRVFHKQRDQGVCGVEYESMITD